MKFSLINNHIIISVETDKGMKNCVFDTGSPMTFFFDESVREFSIDGDMHITSSNLMTTMVALYRSDIERMVGMQVDGFIGTDSFENSNVMLDFPNFRLNISSEAFDNTFGIPMRSMMGLPVFEMKVNGTTFNAAYDSGAMYSFVSSELAGGISLKPQNQTFEDFNPMLGHFTATLYTGNLCVAGKDLGTHSIATSELYDTALQMIGVEAFLGNDTLKHSVIGFSYAENRMGVK